MTDPTIAPGWPRPTPKSVWLQLPPGSPCSWTWSPAARSWSCSWSERSLSSSSSPGRRHMTDLRSYLPEALRLVVVLVLLFIVGGVVVAAGSATSAPVD